MNHCRVSHRGWLAGARRGAAARTGRPRCSASTGAPRPPCAAFDPRWHVRLTFARDGAIVIQCAEDPSGRWHIGTTAWPGKPRLLSQFPAAPQWKNERNGVVFQRQRAQSSAELPERLLSKCARPYCKGLRNRIPPGAPVHKLADSGVWWWCANCAWSGMRCRRSHQVFGPLIPPSGSAETAAISSIRCRPRP